MDKQIATIDALIGKTIASVETDEFYGPLIIHFTDGSWVRLKVKHGWESVDVGVEIDEA